MADIPVVMDMPQAQALVAALLEQFHTRQADQDFLSRCLPVLGQVEEWRYTTGPLFDTPPYQMQMMGFSGGRLLKKGYANLAEARAARVYAAGFIDGRHRITVNPAEAAKFSPAVILYEREEDRTCATVSQQPSLAEPVLSRPATLLGLSESRRLDAQHLLHVGVGTRGAYAAYLYRYEGEKPREVHLFSKGHSAQSNYCLHYDADGELTRVTEPNSNVVWPR